MEKLWAFVCLVGCQGAPIPGDTNIVVIEPGAGGATGGFHDHAHEGGAGGVGEGNPTTGGNGVSQSGGATDTGGATALPNDCGVCLSGSHCDTSTGECVKCLHDDHCLSSARPYCADGVAECSECRDDSHCLDPDLSRCAIPESGEGFCVECLVDSDCSDGQKCHTHDNEDRWCADCTASDPRVCVGMFRFDCLTELETVKHICNLPGDFTCGGSTATVACEGTQVCSGGSWQGVECVAPNGETMEQVDSSTGCPRGSEPPWTRCSDDHCAAPGESCP